MRSRQWVRLNKYVRLEVVPYRTQVPDVWIRVNDRMPNGTHTKKENSYEVKKENLIALQDLIDKAISDIEAKQTGETQ